jgi:hypothetical protein
MLQRIARWEDIDLGGAVDEDASLPWRQLAAH